jgi:hypothetical protein
MNQVTPSPDSPLISSHPSLLHSWFKPYPGKISVILLLASLAIWSVPGAKAQRGIVAPNLANACGNPAIVDDVLDTEGTPTNDFMNPFTQIVLTDGGLQQVGLAFCGSTVDPTAFATAFTFQITKPKGDGFTFFMNGNQVFPQLGPAGGNLGYTGMPNSAAIKFDLYDNAGEGPNSTGLYLNGAMPTVPSIDLTGTGIDLHSGHTFAVLATYVEPVLNLEITDTVTKAAYSNAFTVDLPTVTGGSITAGIGFTGSTGGEGSDQRILNWNTAQHYTPSIDYPTGFTSTFGVGPSVASNEVGIECNVSQSCVQSSVLSLLDGLTNNAQSVYGWDPVNVQAFTSDFTFQISNAVPGHNIPPSGGGRGDGFTFVIQNDTKHFPYFPFNAVGSHGGGLGYSGIANSAAIKFDLYDNAGEGPNSTGLYTNGTAPMLPAIDLTPSGINLHSPDVFHAHIGYDGITLKMTLTDTVTNATFTHSFPIDIPQTVGGPTAYVGFTGGSGSLTSTIQILTWTFINP